MVAERVAAPSSVGLSSASAGAKPHSPTKALKKSMSRTEAARAATELIRRANHQADLRSGERAAAEMRRHLDDACAGAARVQRVWAARTPAERAMALTDVVNRVATAGAVEGDGRTINHRDAVADGHRGVVADGHRDAVADGHRDAVADRWRWYAKWAAKIDRVSVRDGYPAPYGGPHPSGVVAVVAGPDASLLELTSLVAPVLAAGNAAVLLATRKHPATVALVDVTGADRVPTGLVRVVDRTPETLDQLGRTARIDGIDLQGCNETEVARCVGANRGDRRFRHPEPDVDWTEKPGKSRLRFWLQPEPDAVSG